MGDVAFPQDLNFQMKKNAVKCRAYRTTLTPIGGSANMSPSDTIKWDVPVGRVGTYLDTSASYLQLTVKNTTGSGSWNVDGSAYSFIQRLSTYSGGTLLEDIDAYGAFANLMLDAQVSSIDRTTSLSAHMGTNVEVSDNCSRGGITVANAGSTTFCIPLISSVFGSFVSKLLPLGAVSNDLRLEIVLASAVNAVVGAGAVNYQVTSAQLQLSILELDSDAQRMVDASTGGNYYISTECYRNYSTSLASGSKGDNVLIPARFSSVKSVLAIYRPQGNIGASDGTKYAQTSRINPYAGAGSSLQFQIGSSTVPATPITSAAELYTEAVKAFHNFGNTSQSSCIDNSTWAVKTEASTPDANNTGTFYVGYNTESIANRSDVLNTGISTLNQNIFMQSRYTTDYGGNDSGLPSATRLDMFVHFDGVLAIENGIVTMKF